VVASLDRIHSATLVRRRKDEPLWRYLAAIWDAASCAHGPGGDDADTIAIEWSRGGWTSPQRAAEVADLHRVEGLLTFWGGPNAALLVPRTHVLDVLRIPAGRGPADNHVRDRVRAQWPGCDDAPLLCPWRLRKTHGTACTACEGSGFRRVAGPLAGYPRAKGGRDLMDAAALCLAVLMEAGDE